MTIPLKKKRPTRHIITGLSKGRLTRDFVVAGTHRAIELNFVFQCVHRKKTFGQVREMKLI
jgi:hypothetical protein